MVLPADPRFMDDSPSLTGSVECGSRRSFEGIQHAHGVDASAGCLSGHNTSLLCAGDRPICVALEPSAASQIQLMLTGTPYPLPKEKSLLSLPYDQFTLCGSLSI